MVVVRWWVESAWEVVGEKFENRGKRDNILTLWNPGWEQLKSVTCQSIKLLFVMTILWYILTSHSSKCENIRTSVSVIFRKKVVWLNAHSASSRSVVMETKILSFGLTYSKKQRKGEMQTDKQMALIMFLFSLSLIILKDDSVTYRSCFRMFFFF